MNHNTTPPPLTATVAALDLIADLSLKHPDLPAPYLVFSTHDWSVTIGIQSHTLPDFEAWRAALNIDPDNITLFASMLNADLPPRLIGGRQLNMHLYTSTPNTMQRPVAEWQAEVGFDDEPSDCISIPDDWRTRCLAEGIEPPAIPQQMDGSCVHGIPDCICEGAR